MATVDSVLGKIISKKKTGHETEEIVKNIVKDTDGKDCKHGKAWK
jgi:hypothetical protein